MVNDSELPDSYGYYSDTPIRMIDANGESSSSKQGKVYVPKLGKTIDAYLVQSSPPVISVGMRCIDDGFDFVWRGSKGEQPYLVKPNGERIGLVVKTMYPILQTIQRRLPLLPLSAVQASPLLHPKKLSSLPSLTGK